MLHSPSSIKNQKGFTLIELLLVTFLIGALSVLSFNSYISSTRTFSFLQAHKEVMSAVRTARSYALTNRELKTGAIPYNYGMFVDSQLVVFTAEVENPNTECPDPGYVFVIGPEPPRNYCRYRNKTIDLSAKGYSIKLKDSKDLDIALPAFLHYRWQDGNFYVLDKNNNEVSKSQNKFVYLELSDPKSSFKKYTFIFQATGLIEEFSSPDTL